MAEKHALVADAESGYENGDFKRQKIESGAAGGYEQSSYQSESAKQQHYQQPSPVIHVRGVADEAREQDLLHALSPFGPIT